MGKGKVIWLPGCVKCQIKANGHTIKITQPARTRALMWSSLTLGWQTHTVPMRWCWVGWMDRWVQSMLVWLGKYSEKEGGWQPVWGVIMKDWPRDFSRVKRESEQGGWEAVKSESFHEMQVLVGWKDWFLQIIFQIGGNGGIVWCLKLWLGRVHSHW